jgi:hypothetical protein
MKDGAMLDGARIAQALDKEARMIPHVISVPRVREISLRAQVEFTQFGITRAGRVVGISHDDPMRYDLRLEDGAIISNIPEPAIGALMALS